MTNVLFSFFSVYVKFYPPYCLPNFEHLVTQQEKSLLSNKLRKNVAEMYDRNPHLGTWASFPFQYIERKYGELEKVILIKNLIEEVRKYPETNYRYFYSIYMTVQVFMKFFLKPFRLKHYTLLLNIFFILVVVTKCEIFFVD